MPYAVLATLRNQLVRDIPGHLSEMRDCNIFWQIVPLLVNKYEYNCDMQMRTLETRGNPSPWIYAWIILNL